MLFPAKISPTTGEPQRPRQRILDSPSFPQFGAAIPGAERELDPVARLLSRFGLQVYQGPRTPVAGFPPGQLPADLRDEWVREFGLARQALLGPLARAMKVLESKPQEQVIAEIKRRDALAAKRATMTIQARRGQMGPLPPKGALPPEMTRSMTPREWAGPSAFRRKTPVEWAEKLGYKSEG